MGQKKFTDYDVFTAVADDDILLGIDVSDTTQSGAGSSKELPISVLATKIREGTTFKEQSAAAGDFASLADDDKLLGVDVSDSDTAKNLTVSQLLDVDWFTISGNITLNATHNRKTGYITGDAVITLPDYASTTSGWSVELIRDGVAAHAVTLATQGTDTIRGSEATLTGDGSVVRTPTDGQFAAIGGFST